MGLDSDLRLAPGAERASLDDLPRDWESARSEQAPALDAWERCVLSHFQAGPDARCRALAFRHWTRKLLIEFELALDGNVLPERCVGKSWGDDRGKRVFDFQSQVWRAGLRPPSPYTVARPICYIPERNLLLQEKAPGRRVKDFLLGDSPAATSVAARCGAWVAALQALPVKPESSLGKVRFGVERYARELAELFPPHASQIERLAGCALDALAPRQIALLVPSHGDLHPANLLVGDDGRITAIDLDKFGSHERAADVGYFLAQTEIMGYFRHGSFAATRRARKQFLRAYEEATGALSPVRLSLYVGLAFLESLHYELCVFKTGRVELVKPWLAAAERHLGEATERIAK